MNYPISLVVISYNGESRIKKMLDYHRPYFQEIIVLDQGSTDNTKAISEEIADLVVTVRNKGYSDGDREYAFSLASLPHVCYLDDDEFVSEEALATFDKLLASNIDAFWFRRQNMVDGIDIQEILGDDIQCRLWRKGAVKWPQRLHSFPKSAENIKVAFLQTPIIHERTYEGLKAANKAREPFTDQETLSLQNNFLKAVEVIMGRSKNG